MKIPFNVPYMSERELEYIKEAHSAGHLSGDGPFTKKCHEWIEKKTGCHKALLTTSCTTALEMTAVLAGVGPGDEVIMPSFTFVTTANAFVLRGAVPVFVDVRSDTLNIDETLVEEAITPKTKAIVPVHYAGVACDMDAITGIAAMNRLTMIEDAAQGVMANYKGQALGAIGRMGTLSFHESKNIICGEGGALLLNDPELAERAEIFWEKGTDRRDFYRKKIEKYTWRDLGSSCLPSDILAAALLSQLEEAEEITRRRFNIWSCYDKAFKNVAPEYGFSTPVIPDECDQNAHIYYLLAPDTDTRTRFMQTLHSAGIDASFHYIPLHSSPGGKRFGRSSGKLPVTSRVADQIVRLPIWIGMEDRLEYVVETAIRAMKR